MKATFVLVLVIGLIFSLKAEADGCFVFVWNKAKDINEPTQKAIIVHDAGREDLILQVKYEGPVEQFGWLIPVPGLPTVQKGSMECFYELSRYTQEHFDPRYEKSHSTSGFQGEGKPETVKVIEVKTVGAYEVAVLSAKSAGSLENWLNENHFSFPQDKADVIDSYVKQQWYWIAAKISLGGDDGFKLVTSTPKAGKAWDTNSTPAKLARGELHPLQISFDSAKCVFPLKISSVNGTPSEVQVCVLSPEPLVERTMFEKMLPEEHLWRANYDTELREFMARLRTARLTFRGTNSDQMITKLPERVEPDDQLSRKSIIHEGDLLPYGVVTTKDIPACGKQLPRLKGKSWWLTKQTWKFKPEEMRDLTFQPAIPVFVDKLADEEGYFVAANLVRLGANAFPALAAALQSTNPLVRTHVASTAEKLFPFQSPEPEVDGDGDPVKPTERNPKSNQTRPDSRLIKLLPLMLKDAEPEVRMYGVFGAENCWNSGFVDPLMALMRDEYEEVGQAAARALGRHPEEVSKHAPVFLRMLREERADIQLAALRLLRILGTTIPREDLLSLFKVPRMDVAGLAYQQLRREPISCEEALPLLHNAAWSPRLMGLGILRQNASKQSVEYALPLLKDPEEIVRVRANRLLQQLTGQDIPLDQPEKWEQWWTQNKATFTPKPLPSRNRPIEPDQLPPVTSPPR